MSDMFMFMPTKLFWALMIIWLSAVLIIVVGWEWIYGQDIDPRYVCLYKDRYPFNKMCQEQRINNAVKDALKLAKDNDAKFCHIFANLSYCQDRCEIDESLCVLGIPDADINDTGTEDPCFANKELADKYMDSTGDKNATGDIHIPCPPYNYPHGDESGK